MCCSLKNKIRQHCRFAVATNKLQDVLFVCAQKPKMIQNESLTLVEKFKCQETRVIVSGANAGALRFTTTQMRKHLINALFQVCIL